MTSSPPAVPPMPTPKPDYRPRFYKIERGLVRWVWADGSLWHRTYTPGGFDGYRTLCGARRTACQTLALMWARAISQGATE